MPIQKTIFTDRLEKYITTPPEERKKRYEPNEIRTNNYKIKKYAKSALKNLAIIAAGYEEKRVGKIFDIELMEFLLKSVIPKIGHEQTWNGKYYNVLIHAIADAANSNVSQKRERIEVDVKTRPLTNGRYGGYDLTDPHENKYAFQEYERLKQHGKL